MDLWLNFDGGNMGDQHGIFWMSWQKLRQPKALGGLGFCSLREFNRALLAK